MSDVRRTVQPEELEISGPETHGGVEVFHLRGRLDAKAAERVRASCSELVANGSRDVALELSSVSFVSSSGLGVFLALNEELKEVQGKFRLISPSQTAHAVIKLLNLNRYLTIEESVDALV